MAAALKTAYLTLYNGACLAGWTYVNYKIVNHYAQGGKPETLWNSVEEPLKIAQTAAIMEVLHAATGLVRSSVATTFVQGACSRLLALRKHSRRR